MLFALKAAKTGFISLVNTRGAEEVQMEGL